ncbi:MAG: hypothetical protein JNJ58_02460 [Chitinophagaceae bacterium]|nr:hypothetical protein [Chitinophagaceae bacterium]
MLNLHPICRFRFCMLLLMSLGSFQSRAQTDTLTENEIVAPFPDSIFRFNVKKPVAKRAALYSALIPGLGQIYNKQYWKAGVVYAAAGVVTGFMISNYSNYDKYRKAYISRIDNNPETTDTFTEYTTDDLNLLRKGFRKYTEYTVISGTLCYILNILDAFVSAHLRSFDMSKDISFKSKPYLTPNGSCGIGLAIHF